MNDRVLLQGNKNGSHWLQEVGNNCLRILGVIIILGGFIAIFMDINYWLISWAFWFTGGSLICLSIPKKKCP
jgi:hypothetical protein